MRVCNFLFRPTLMHGIRFVSALIKSHLSLFFFFCTNRTHSFSFAFSAKQKNNKNEQNSYFSTLSPYLAFFFSLSAGCRFNIRFTCHCIADRYGLCRSSRSRLSALLETLAESAPSNGMENIDGLIKINSIHYNKHSYL